MDPGGEARGGACFRGWSKDCGTEGNDNGSDDDETPSTSTEHLGNRAIDKSAPSLEHIGT